MINPLWIAFVAAVVSSILAIATIFSHKMIPLFWDAVQFFVVLFSIYWIASCGILFPLYYLLMWNE